MLKESKHSFINKIDRAVCLSLDLRMDYSLDLQKQGKQHGIDIQLYICGDGQQDLKYDYIDTDIKPSMFPESQSNSYIFHTIRYSLDKTLVEQPVTTRYWFEKTHLYNAWHCHRKIVEKAYLDGCKNLMLFEDDACFVDDFEEKFSVVNDFLCNNYWDIIYFGSSSRSYNNIISEGICRSTGCSGLYGILLNRNILKIVKDFAPYGTMDWMIDQLCHKYVVYRLIPPVINFRNINSAANRLVDKPTVLNRKTNQKIKTRLISSISRSVCLTLDKKIDMANDLVEQGKQNGLNIELYIAGDGSNKNLKYDYIDVDRELIQNKNSMPCDKKWDLTVLYNIIECQKNIMNKACNDGCDNLMLFEDDALITDNFKDVVIEIEPFLLDNPWDIVYFGHFDNSMYTKKKYVHKNLFLSNGCNGFHAVLLSRKIMKQLKNFESCGALDWLVIQHIHPNSDYKCFCVDPQVVRQKVSYNYYTKQLAEAERIKV